MELVTLTQVLVQIALNTFALLVCVSLEKETHLSNIRSPHSACRSGNPFWIPTRQVLGNFHGSEELVNKVGVGQFPLFTAVDSARTIYASGSATSALFPVSDFFGGQK